jgi:hypothetical protein
MTDCAVVGAGPAGLAASLALAGRGVVDHVVLERDRVAATWRDQRWDSFRLNTAGWMNAMLGEQARHAYATATEVVHRRWPGPAPLRPDARRRWTASGSPSTTAWPRTSPPGMPSPPGRGRWWTRSSAAAAWTRPPPNPTSTTPRSVSIRRPASGLWYLGLRWLRRRASGILLGFPGDAAWVATAVRARLDG